MSSRPIASRIFDDDPRHVDHFALLLILSVASVGVLSFVDLKSPFENVGAEIGWVIVTIVVGVTLAVALRASGVAKRVRRVAEWAIAFAVIVSAGFTIAEAISDEPVYAGTLQPGWLWVFLAAVAPVVVVRRLLKAERVSSQTLLGAVAAFLLIALLANYAFLTIDSIQSTPFFGSEQQSTVFMYYSLVTITTLGYGDFSAATELGRFASTAEAITGQVYLVTVVATFVSLNTTRVRESRRGQSAS